MGDVERRLDALVVRAVPDVRKVVRWNSPFYGVAGEGWFFTFHCMTKKHEKVRYVHIHEGEEIDEDLLAAGWQAAAQPGDPLF